MLDLGECLADAVAGVPGTSVATATEFPEDHSSTIPTNVKWYVEQSAVVTGEVTVADFKAELRGNLVDALEDLEGFQELVDSGCLDGDFTVGSIVVEALDDTGAVSASPTATSVPSSPLLDEPSRAPADLRISSPSRKPSSAPNSPSTVPSDSSSRLPSVSPSAAPSYLSSGSPFVSASDAPNALPSGSPTSYSTTYYDQPSREPSSSLSGDVASYHILESGACAAPIWTRRGSRASAPPLLWELAGGCDFE